MGGLAIDQVQRAVNALVSGDEAAGKEVVRRHDLILAEAQAIEEESLAIIASRQPVASDLRAILIIGRVATDLERVGHAARKISRSVAEISKLDGGALVPFHADLRKTARAALGMLRDALDCFDRVDLAGAQAVERRDAELDVEFELAVRTLLTRVMEDPRRLRGSLDTVFALKAIERVGDHARNIALTVPRLVSRDALPPGGALTP